jgi:hypothetical protein
MMGITESSLCQSCSWGTGCPVVRHRLVMTLLGRVGGVLVSSIISQALPFDCFLCTINTKSVLFLVISAATCW